MQQALAAWGYHKCKACPKPFISEAARQKRLLYCKEKLDWDINKWKPFIFSDECTFTTGKQQKAYVIRTDQERYCPDCLQHRYHSGRATFSIWAAIGWDFKSELIFIESHGSGGGMSKEDYKEQILTRYVGPLLKDKLGLIFIEDGNTAYRLKDDAMKKFKADLHITCLSFWPPSSPDFNPTENVWRIIKQRLKNWGPFLRIEDLKAAVQEEWDKLTQLEINKLLVTLPQRMQEAYERNGLATRF